MTVENQIALLILSITNRWCQVQLAKFILYFNFGRGDDGKRLRGPGSAFVQEKLRRNVPLNNRTSHKYWA